MTLFIFYYFSGLITPFFEDYVGSNFSSLLKKKQSEDREKYINLLLLQCIQDYFISLSEFLVIKVFRIYFRGECLHRIKKITKCYRKT